MRSQNRRLPNPLMKTEVYFVAIQVSSVFSTFLPLFPQAHSKATSSKVNFGPKLAIPSTFPQPPIVL